MSIMSLATWSGRLILVKREASSLIREKISLEGISSEGEEFLLRAQPLVEGEKE